METLQSGTTRVTVTPELGATVTSFSIGEQQVFFPETMIEYGATTKRRGGMPVLFPMAGKLSHQPSGWNLSQHGFARDMPWEVVQRSPDTVRMRLVSSDETRAQFPFDFVLEATASVGEKTLTYGLEIENTSKVSLPVAPGLHPYYYIPVARKSQIQTNIEGFDPLTFDWNDTLWFAAQPELKVSLPQSFTLTVKSSPEFAQVAIWSEPDRDYVCVEPWVGPLDAILHPDQALTIPSSGKVRLQTVMVYSE